MSTQYTSRVVATMRALLEALQGTEFGATGVDVAVNYPLDAPALEYVFIHPRIEGEALQAQASFGPGNRTETFGLIVTVASGFYQADPLAALDRVTEMTAAVETAIRLNSVNTPNNKQPRPDVDGVQWWEVRSGNPEAYATDQGWWANCSMVVSVRAHI